MYCGRIRGAAHASHFIRIDAAPRILARDFAAMAAETDLSSRSSLSDGYFRLASYWSDSRITATFLMTTMVDQNVDSAICSRSE